MLALARSWCWHPSRSIAFEVAMRFSLPRFVPVILFALPGALAAQTKEESQAPAAKEAAKEPASDRVAAIAKLIAQLGHDDYATRQRAQEELMEIGAEAFDALAESQNHDDPEIAARSRYLLRSIRVELAREGDGAGIRQQLKDYHSLNAAQRAERVEALAAVTDAAALAVLCRIARYEHSEAVSKHAAVAVIGQKLLPGTDEKGRGERIVETLGGSQRPASRWLRAYVEASRGVTDRLESEWAKLSDEEAALLRRAPERSDADIVSGLLKHRIELLARLKRDKDFEPVLRQLVEVQPEDGETLAEFIAWVQEKKAWTALDGLQKRFAVRIDSEPLLLYALASAREAQGEQKVADETAAKALALNADKVDAHYSTALMLRDRGMMRWAEKEFRQLIASPPKDNIYAMFSRYILSELLHDQERHADSATLLQETVAAMQGNIKAGPEKARHNGQRELGSVKARMHYFRALELRESDPAKYVEHLDKAIEADPTDADALIALYRLPDQDAARRAKTLDLIEKAVETFRQQIIGQADKLPDERAGAHNQLAWLVGNTEGNYQEALDASLKSLELKPDTAAYLDTLGRCYYAVKDYQNALKHQRMAVERDPHSKQMRRQLSLFEKAAAEAVKKPK
jgi:tetratricopeptide (TPR) repeat protein